ncbi:MAG: hypothetical protein N2557_06115 [Hydrogenophilus sp.]|nr:hypothetical protein [Hydrogenophilus sp.]
MTLSPIHRLESPEPALIAPLFAAAFRKPLDPALWCWKYGNRRGFAYLYQPDSTAPPIAHYGALTRTVWYRQRPFPALQIVDVMASPAARSSLTPLRPIAQLAHRLLTTDLGHGRPHLIGFGFPNARAFRYFSHLGYYTAVGEILSLSPSPGSSPSPPPRLTIAPLEWSNLLLPPWPRFLARTVATLARHHLLLDRTPLDLLHRYAHHPTRRYTLHALWHHPPLSPPRPLALAVLAASVDPPHPPELLDLIAPPADLLSAWHLLITHYPTLTAWATPAIARLLRPLVSVTPLAIFIPHNALSPQPHPDEIRHRWWLWGGDSDYR